MANTAFPRESLDSDAGAIEPRAHPARSPVSRPGGAAFDGDPVGAARRTNATTRRWTLNGDFATLSPTGVARHARETTRALDALIVEGHPLTRGLALDLVAPRETGLDLAAIGERIVPEFDRPRLPQVWVQAQLPRHVRGGLVSFCNLAPALTRRHIACIHDMQTRTCPDSYGAGFRLAHRLVQPALGRRCRAIAAVSRHAMAEIARFGVADPARMRLVGNGADHALAWRPHRAARLAPAGGYVLALGRRDRHKNMELVVELAWRLVNHALTVVVAGDFGEADLAALGAGFPPNLKLLGRVDDDALARLYVEADCFVFPSRAEGFGLPALEAMTLGCATLAARAGALPEVCGDGAALFEPDDADGFAAEALRLSRDPDRRGAARLRARETAARHTWRATALAYLAAMAEIDAQDAAPLEPS